MIESPWLEDMTQKIVAKATAEATAKTLLAAIADNLEARFGNVVPERLVVIEGVTNPARLKQLLRRAATCASLDAFFDQLNS